MADLKAGGRGVSRRVVLGGMVAATAWAQAGSKESEKGKKKGGRVKIFKERVGPNEAPKMENVGIDNWPVMLYVTDAQGNHDVAKPLGAVISIPQVCRSETYGTPEWIKEITYLDLSKYDPKNNYAAAKADAYDALVHVAVSDMPYASGCGHMSKNVTVKAVQKNTKSEWVESLYGSAYSYYCVVAAGTGGVDTYEASEIWISTSDWDTTSGTAAYDVLVDICCNRSLPTSICQGSKAGPCAAISCVAHR